MVLFSRNSSGDNLVRTASSALAECNFLGQPCGFCDNTPPETIIATISGIKDNIEGGCVWSGSRADFPFFFHERTTGLPTSLVQGVPVELTQGTTLATRCRWFGGIEVSAENAFLTERFVSTSSEPDCSSFFSSARAVDVSYEAFVDNRPSANLIVRVPGLDTIQALLPRVDISADDCVCVADTGLSSEDGFQLWDYKQGSISLTSVTCNPLHLKTFTASALLCDPATSGHNIIASATVHDENHLPFQSAFVSVSVTGVASDQGSDTTNLAGIASFSFSCVCASGSATVAVANITAPGFGWDRGADETNSSQTLILDCV